MKKIQYITLLTLLAAVVYSCGESSDLAEKKAQLEEYNKQMAELKGKISELQAEIAELDTAKTNGADGILVALYDLKQEPFVHKIEVRGSVESRKNVMISAETAGRIEAIHVREGQEVAKGTLLMKLDADILENNLAELKTQLELAETVYMRQDNLWKQNIGTEIQYLEAKNNKESLERRISTLNSQLAQAYVRAPFSGVVDNVPVKVGEMAQPGLPLVRIVSQKDMYVSADVSEAYLGKLHTGDQVEAYFQAQDTTITTKITAVGKVINQENRTFEVEVSLPDNAQLGFQPNQVTVLTFVDYKNEAAFSVPSKIVQADEEGKYIYVVETKDGQPVAQKARITVGKTFSGETEIVSGLTGDEKIIEKGYRDVNAGAQVTIAKTR